MKKALRYNNDKPKLSYFRRSFRQALHCIARIKAFGAVKYDDGNWRLGGKPDVEYLDSMDRHLDLFLNGEVYDDDSGCHHLGHAIWNLCALFELNYGDLPVIDEEKYKERMDYWKEKRRDRVPQFPVGETVVARATSRPFTGSFIEPPQPEYKCGDPEACCDCDRSQCTERADD